MAAFWADEFWHPEFWVEGFWEGFPGLVEFETVAGGGNARRRRSNRPPIKPQAIETVKPRPIMAVAKEEDEEEIILMAISKLLDG